MSAVAQAWLEILSKARFLEIIGLDITLKWSTKTRLDEVILGTVATFLPRQSF